MNIPLAAAGIAMGLMIAPKEPSFRKTVLDTEFRAEGVAAADVNRDGRPDIMAGDFWYEAPTWKPHEVAPPAKYDGAAGYSDCFEMWAADVNRDGWPDQIRIGMPGGPADWRENPGRAGGHWKRHQICASACNESPVFERLLGADKPPVLVFPIDEAQMAWLEPGPDPTAPWIVHRVGDAKAPGTQRFSHGLGVGDVNGDGRADILTTEGYYAAPRDPRSSDWRFVPAQLGPGCAHMLVYDVNQDGLPDVITSAAHGVGIWWFEQRRTPKGTEFAQHEIDSSFSQTHALILADIDKDGIKDIVTGKRFWAHGPSGDIEPNAPAVVCWYKLTRQGGLVAWAKRVVDSDSGVGTQFTVTDLDKDGRLDIVTANKKGVFCFRQVR